MSEKIEGYKVDIQSGGGQSVYQLQPHPGNGYVNRFKTVFKSKQLKCLKSLSRPIYYFLEEQKFA